MKVFQIPGFVDNYFYILNRGGLWAVVDPGDFQPIFNFLEDHRVKKLDFIFNTHHHFDHIGANLALKKKYNCQILSSHYDKKRIPLVDKSLCDKDTFFFSDLEVKVIFCPGHTLGHIAYWFEKEKKLFCGDTLFAMGCGRLFEGSPEQMLHSLNRFKTLPSETSIYCAHEYTQKNALFSLSVDPKNKALKERQLHIKALRKAHQPTVPFFLKEELATNPFLRSNNKQLKNTLGFKDSESELTVFTELRKRRDVF